MSAQEGAKPYYFVPQPSYWPVTGSFALLLMAMGAAFWFNNFAAGPWLVLAGSCVLVFMMFGWFGTVIGESEGLLYNKRVDHSFRWSMSWFIFSEVMFFAAFFGALFYIRNLSVPDLGSLSSKILWPDYTYSWPTVGPYIKEHFTPMAAIVQDRYKLVVTFEDGLVELYDLRADPDEQVDLASEVRVPQLRRALEVYRDIDGYP